MTSSRIATAAQVRTMTAVVRAYCLRHGIEVESDRECVAMNVLTLFEEGMRDHDGFVAGLDAMSARRGSRP